VNTSAQIRHAPTVLQHFVGVVVATLRNTAAAWKRSRRRRSRRRERASPVAELIGNAPAPHRGAMRCMQ
jgi:hypothetical protein